MDTAQDAVDIESDTRQQDPSAADTQSGFVPTLVTLLSGAIEAHRAGDLDAAEQAYRAVLETTPDHPHALHFLGVIEHQRGNNQVAIDLIERAIAQLPEFADAYSNLGAACRADGRLSEAESAFRRATELSPALPEAHSNLAVVLKEQGKKQDAITAYESAHAAAPADPAYLKRLADYLLENEKFDRAAELFRSYLDLAPSDAEVWNNLGYCHERTLDFDEAANCYSEAVRLSPDSPEINNNYGSVLGRLGRLEEADEYFARAVDLDPDRWEDLSNLAGTLVNRREVERALPLFEKLVKSRPDDAKLFNDYGIALSLAGKLSVAEAQFAHAIKINPDYAEAFNNLGSNMLNQGRRPDAIAVLRKAIEIMPDYVDAHINLCLALCQESRFEEAYIIAQRTVMLEGFHPEQFSNPHKVFRAVCDFDSIEALGDLWENIEQTRASDFSANFLEMLVVADTRERIERLVALHHRWGEDVLRRTVNSHLPPVEAGSRTGKIRIGIISSDLRHHSVAKFVLPILENYDQEKFEFYCYSPFEDTKDQVQQKIRSLIAEFRVMQDISDHEFAETIRADKIDILFELNGFTRDTKLKVMAYKPAPVQIYWLGYPFTTGVKEIDYILLDPHVKPVNEEWLVEKPLLMPECWVCFGEFPDEPISLELPVERNGAITFGSQNNPYKLTREVIALWSRVMQKVPNSRFLYVRPECSSLILRKNLVEEFERNGIGPERLFFVNNWDHGLSHLGYYNEIDITLDTFPLTGGTTTCDTLWMGVPVITKFGPSMHQRLSFSHLTNVHLADLSVEDDDSFVEVAVDLANDHDSLRLLRQELRNGIKESALCRSEDFYTSFEKLMLELVSRHELR